MKSDLYNQYKEDCICVSTGVKNVLPERPLKTSLPDQQQYASSEQSKLPDPSRIRSKVPANMPKLLIPSTVTKFPPEITVTPPTPTLLSPKGSISEETKQRLKVSCPPPDSDILWDLQEALNAAACFPYRTSSYPPSLRPRWRRTPWPSRCWRCRKRPARSRLWRASRTRRTTTWTSELKANSSIDWIFLCFSFLFENVLIPQQPSVSTLMFPHVPLKDRRWQYSQRPLLDMSLHQTSVPQHDWNVPWLYITSASTTLLLYSQKK